MDTTFIILGSGSLVCLTPLAVYLLYLSYLNGRSQPTLVSGPWDFAAVLLGLSGFVLLTGPLLITLVDSTWRAYAFAGWAKLKSVGQAEARAGSLMATGYCLILLGVIPILLRSRKHVTAIYNVTAGSVEATLEAIADELGYAWRKNQGRLEIGRKNTAPPADRTTRISPSPEATAFVRVDAFAAVGHASLKWGGDWSTVRTEIEAALSPNLLVHRSGRNPVAGWLFTAAMTIMILMLLWLVVLIYVIMVPVTG